MFPALFPLPRPPRLRVRAIRRPFHPSPAPGPYRLPHDVRDRLTASLAPFRNREAAFALAVFLARFWSAPGRLTRAFPIDRRALADHPELGLTEARVRGAIHALEEVGFLERAIVPPGSRFKATADGLQRKPILYGFGSDIGAAFAAAHRRVTRKVAREGRPRLSPEAINRLRHPVASSPKIKTPLGEVVFMGETFRQPASTAQSPSALEAALARFKAAGGW